jgi:hypothetical protein
MRPDRKCCGGEVEEIIIQYRCSASIRSSVCARRNGDEPGRHSTCDLRSVMPPLLMLALVLIPSMLFAYVVLATFYGANRAYLAISWLPLGYLVVIWISQLILAFQNLSDRWWRELATTIAWAGLIQAGLGVGLIVRSLYRRKGTGSLILATSASASPFLLGLIR